MSSRSVIVTLSWLAAGLVTLTAVTFLRSGPLEIPRDVAFRDLELSADGVLLDTAGNAAAEPDLRAAAFYHLGMRALRKDQGKLAEEYLTRAVESQSVGLFPTTAAYELAKLCEQSFRASTAEVGRRDKALALYRRFLGNFKGYDKTPYALHRGGLLAAASGDTRLANEFFAALVGGWKEFRDLKSCVIAYADNLTRAGEYGTVETMLLPFTLAWREDLVFLARALLARAYARERAGKRDEAKKDYERLAAEFVASPEAALARNTLAKWKN